MKYLFLILISLFAISSANAIVGPTQLPAKAAQLQDPTPFGSNETVNQWMDRNGAVLWGEPICWSYSPGEVRGGVVVEVPMLTCIVPVKPKGY